MPRKAREVFAGYPHHVTQRGNRSQKVFFCHEDRERYKSLLLRFSREFGLKIWAYCLMNNHVHLIVVPEKPESLAIVIGRTHKQYTENINSRKGWRGSLWQGRFKSNAILTERYVYSAVRYVERNPVRAGIVERAEDYLYSSAAARVRGVPDKLVSDFYLTTEIKDWATYLRGWENEKDMGRIRVHVDRGNPLS